ncbi:hypothetical protein FB451DRAFT_1237130 [Mycena latifolia]|nr:hypothetical protein FB451DRAFT_1237130 [Mycena latifolia]
MGRWTQFDEDSTRLPEGMKRIGYDADTARYTFRDREGNTYLGPPNEQYGFLTVVGPSSFMKDRPQAFAPANSKPRLSVQPPDSGLTFHDFLPTHLITSASPVEASAGSRFLDALRRAALPSMPNVRRSATSARKPIDYEKKGLHPMELTRSTTSSTTSTLVSFSMDKKGAKH